MFCVFFFKQKTAYDMRISDWSSDVCSSDLPTRMPEMTSAYDYALLRNQVEEQNDRSPLYDEEELEHYRLGDSQELFPTRDFVKEFMKDAFPMRRVNVKIGRASCRERVCKYV